jgi:Xaa-Pro aminopeptidase
VSDWRLWGGKGFAILPKGGEPILVLGTGSQSHWAKSLSLISDVRAASNMIDEIGHVVDSLGLGRGRIGVAGMDHVMFHGDVARLMQRLGHAEVRDATAPVDDVMAVKSTEELALINETYSHVAGALDVFRQELAPGRSEREVMSKAVHYLAERGCLDGIAHLAPGYKPFFRPPIEREFERDDIIKVSLEFAGPSGYWIELAGVYSFMQPPERLSRYYDTSLRAIRNVAAMLKPGVTGGDVTHTVEATYREDGWKVTGRGIWDGHLIGLNVIRPPYGEADNTDVFRENMVFNLHPGLLVDDDQIGMFLQDNLIVTPQGGRSAGEYTYAWHVLA